jgi:hypothetical protein
MRHISICAVAAFLFVGTTPARAATAPLVPTGILMARIDTDCAVYKSVTKDKPAALLAAFSAGTGPQWKVYNEAGFTQLVRSPGKQLVGTARVWKHNGKVFWVEVHSTNVYTDTKHKASYCYRLNGTLARVRRGTVWEDATRVRSVYLDDKGNIIGGTLMANAGDVTLYKTVETLPFHALIPI